MVARRGRLRAILGAILAEECSIVGRALRRCWGHAQDLRYPVPERLLMGHGNVLFRKDPSQLSGVRPTLRRRHGHRDVQAPLFARASGADIKMPKAVDAAFAGVDEEITAAIAAYRSQWTRKLETDLFEQRARLVAAEKKLAVKITRKGSEDVRIATNKIDAATRGNRPSSPAGPAGA